MWHGKKGAKNHRKAARKERSKLHRTKHGVTPRKAPVKPVKK